MTNFTELSNKELSEAIDFHRRQRNMSRGVNESAHMRQTQVVRLLEAEEARRLNEAVNEKQIKKDLDSGMSHDVVIGKHANKNTTNTDEIREVIKQHAWDNRMKKEEVELDESIGGLFKDSSEWERSAKDRGLVVKPATHPSGEMTKYQIAKDKQGNNRGHFDHGTKSGRLTEEVELNENSPQHVPGKKWDETKEKWVTVKRSAYDPKKERGRPSTPDQGQKRSDFDEANIHRDFSDNPTPLPNKLTYALDKSNPERKPVSLKKAPWDVKKEEVELDELDKKTLGSYVRKSAIDAYRRGQDVEYHTGARDKTDNFGTKMRHAELTDKARFKASNRIAGIEKATHKMAKEEVELDELKTEAKDGDGANIVRDREFKEPKFKFKSHPYGSPEWHANKAAHEKFKAQQAKKAMKNEGVELDEGHYHVSWSPNLSHTVMNAKSADHAVAAAKAHLIKKIPKLADEKYGDTFEKKPRVTNITKDSE
jgi:hypothetical protein